MRDPQRTAQQILEAAERVILRNGVAKATLDEIAREASISKGGVLHHFPSKEAVLVAVLQGLIARFEAGIDAKRKEDPAPKGAFTRAFLRSMLDPDTSCADVFLALNAAFSYTPALLALHRETSSRWQRQVEEDGIDTTNASIVRFAADGLGWARLYGVPAPSEEVRASVIRALVAFTQ